MTRDARGERGTFSWIFRVGIKFWGTRIFIHESRVFDTSGLAVALESGTNTIDHCWDRQERKWQRFIGLQKCPNWNPFGILPSSVILNAMRAFFISFSMASLQSVFPFSLSISSAFPWYFTGSEVNVERWIRLVTLIKRWLPCWEVACNTFNQERYQQFIAILSWWNCDGVMAFSRVRNHVLWFVICPNPICSQLHWVYKIASDLRYQQGLGIMEVICVPIVRVVCNNASHCFTELLSNMICMSWHWHLCITFMNNQGCVGCNDTCVSVTVHFGLLVPCS